MASSSSPLLIGKNRRSRTEIIGTILNVTQDGESQVKILKKTRLNPKQLKLYLGELTKLRLIEINHANGREVYITTQRGNQYLKRYSILRKMLT
jgi:predicted transcriptional regulator